MPGLGTGRKGHVTTYSIIPTFGFDWPRFQIQTDDGRTFGRFRDRAEADAYVAKLETTPLAVPGRPVDPELRAMADEAAAMLVLRSFDWKRKKNPVPEPVVPRFDDNEEIPF
jgi:hypothetical protein